MKNTETEEVIFRVYKHGVFKGRVVAIFPYLFYSDSKIDCEHVTCYEHTGQHGCCYYPLMLKITRIALPSEYQDLKKELNDLGYNLLIVQKRNKSKAKKLVKE